MKLSELNKNWPEKIKIKKTRLIHPSEVVHELINGTIDECDCELPVDVEKIVKLIEIKMDSMKKPNFLFQNRLYPSHGVERIVRQDSQIREFAQAIADNIKDIIKAT